METGLVVQSLFRMEHGGSPRKAKYFCGNDLEMAVARAKESAASPYTIEVLVKYVEVQETVISIVKEG